MGNFLHFLILQNTITHIASEIKSVFPNEKYSFKWELGLHILPILNSF